MLTFNLKKEWFEKIKSGEKTHEYRLAGDYWDKRVLNIIAKYEIDPEVKELQYGYMKHCIKPFYTNFSIPVEIPCCFALGYPKKNDKEKLLFGKITRINLSNNKVSNLNCDLKTDKPVYDFKFELIKEE
ncbi:MAG: hypothetical protein IKR34_02095 [Candidatus Gastranaerophilales bacterium]|nr:hypothetical protein [Elusimicrobiota bacterium]MBR6298015.1 hypothetical protein [Candidatus Gastranaerophilales bacterium]